MSVNIPDPQHAMLTALLSEVDRLRDLGIIDADEYEFMSANEPHSHVFFSEDLDRDYVDFEDAMDTVRAVGERDLDAKIKYWTRELEKIRDASKE